MIPAEFGDRGDDFEQGRVRGGRYPGAYGFQRALSEPARLLRVDEAAAMLAISGRHLREMIAQQPVCTDVRNSPDEGYPPRGVYTAATGPVRILVVGKNPGHILPHEAALYTGKPAAEVARAHLGFAGATFEGAQHAEPVSSRSTMFHRRLRRYLVTVLGVAEDDVFKHAAYTNLVKCSTADEQARLHGGTMRECFARHLQREIAFFVPVALLALGGEVAHFLRRAARTGMHDRPVLRVKHPSYPYRKDELDAVLEDLRRQLVALSARGAR